MPPASFYSIQNDVLSPLCFGAAFICLVKLLRADAPGARLGTATGLALAATYLTKISNLALLGLAAIVVGYLCLREMGSIPHATRNMSRIAQYEGLRKILAGSLLCAAIVFAIAFWWYARNWMLYGDPLALTSALRSALAFLIS